MDLFKDLFLIIWLLNNVIGWLLGMRIVDLLKSQWNSDGEYGPERYVEVHVWSDDPIAEYL